MRRIKCSDDTYEIIKNEDIVFDVACGKYRKSVNSPKNDGIEFSPHPMHPLFSIGFHPIVNIKEVKNGSGTELHLTGRLHRIVKIFLVFCCTVLSIFQTLIMIRLIDEIKEGIYGTTAPDLAMFVPLLMITVALLMPNLIKEALLWIFAKRLREEIDDIMKK